LNTKQQLRNISHSFIIRSRDLKCQFEWRKYKQHSYSQLMKDMLT